MDNISFAKNFIDAFNNANVQYCIVDVDEDNRYIDALVQIDDYERCKKLMTQ